MQVETIELLRQTIPSFDQGTQREIEHGLTTPTYAPFLAEMARYSAGAIRSGTLLDSQLVGLALVTASKLFCMADEDYRLGGNPVLSGEALKRHQANVLAGKIELVPREFGTTPEQSIRQVDRANASLLRFPDIAAIMAAINYGALFRPQTMASATRTLERHELSRLLALVDSSQEAMPHLTVSNWAISQVSAGLYQHMAQLGLGRIRIIDIGSGPGGTIAAQTSSILDLGDIGRRPELAISALEITPEYIDQITHFAQEDKGIATLNLRPNHHSWEAGANISSYGGLTIVRGDAVNSIIRSDIDSNFQPSDLTVVTANYSLHRFSSIPKGDIINLFSRIPNCVLIFGDLVDNTSLVNSLYFNLGANGPLNCGNRYLSNILESSGFSIVDLSRERPSTLDPRLAQEIKKKLSGD